MKLNISFDEPLSNFAFNFNLRRFAKCLEMAPRVPTTARQTDTTDGQALDAAGQTDTTAGQVPNAAGGADGVVDGRTVGGADGAVVGRSGGGADGAVCYLLLRRGINTVN